jgi:hypothetical protein
MGKPYTYMHPYMTAPNPSWLANPWKTRNGGCGEPRGNRKGRHPHHVWPVTMPKTIENDDTGDVTLGKIAKAIVRSRRYLLIGGDERAAEGADTRWLSATVKKSASRGVVAEGSPARSLWIRAEEGQPS